MDRRRQTGHSEPRPRGPAGRASRRRRLAGAQLIALGAGISLSPLAGGDHPLTRAIARLAPVGGAMLALGAVALLAERLVAGRRRARKPGPAPSRAGSTGTEPSRSLSDIAAAAARVDAGAAGSADDAQQASASRGAADAAALPSSGGRPAPPQAWSVEAFGLIEWRRFEALVESLYRQAGFETRSRPHGADGGVDIWLFSPAAPGEPVSVVRCRNFRDRRVGVALIRALRGVMAARNVPRGQFVCASRFTSEAEAFARENGIHLIDGEALLSLIARRTPAQQQALLDAAFDGEWWRPTCPSCGDRMVERAAREGARPFWGCAHFPRCRAVLPIRRG